MIFDIKKWSESKSLKAVVITIVTLAVFAFIFQAGVFVGFHKASFLFKSGDNFYRNFGEKGGMMNMMGRGGMFNDEYTGGHGASGKIVKIELPNIVVLGQDNIEKVVVTDSKTDIREGRSNSSLDKLKVDEFITVIGSPNDQGQVLAKFIRVMPSQMKMMMSSSTNIR
mgnify:CR=1 FL=1